MTIYFFHISDVAVAPPHSTESDATNETIQTTLQHLESMQKRHNAEIEQIASALRRLLKPLDWDGNFAAALETFQSAFDFDKEFGLDEIKAMFATPERQEALTRLRDPTLLLVPEDAFGALVRAIDRSKLAPSQTYVNADVFGKFGWKSEEREKVNGIRPIVIESSVTPMVAPFDDADKTLGERRAIVRANRAPGVYGVDRHAYAALMLHSLRSGAPVDPQTYTIFDDDEACTETRLPYGDWHGVQAYFDWRHPVLPGADARFRSSVGGDVIA